MKRVLFYLFAAVIIFPAETLKAQSVSPTSDPGVTLNGIVWATRNVDTAGKFVANPEDFGNHFSFEEAQTACPEGWRPPVMDELRTLMQMKYTNSEWMKVNGVAGRRFGNGGNVLFLPATGVRIQETDKHDVRSLGIAGYYWSSILNDAGEDNKHNKGSAMWFDDYDCNRFMSGNNTTFLTLRCVRK